MTGVRTPVENHLQAAWAAGRMAASQIEQAERAMNAKPEPKLAEDFLNGEMGGRHYRATIFCELQEAARRVFAETQHDDDFDPAIREACERIMGHEFKV